MARPIADMLAAVETSEYARLEFARLPEGWWAVLSVGVLLALCAAVVWLYRHEERRSASGAVRNTLAVLRTLVIVALAAIWLEPIWAKYLLRRYPSYTLVLTDRSASMALADRYRDPDAKAAVDAFLKSTNDSADAGEPMPRVALADALLTGNDQRFITSLEQRNAVRLLDFDENLRAGDEREDSDGAAVADSMAPADGVATDIGRSVRSAVESVGGATVAGIVLLSDGGVNRGEPPAAVAAFAEAHDIPIYAVGLGDPASPINLRVVDGDAPSAVFMNDPFEITAQVVGTAENAEQIDVDLVEAGADGDERMIATETVPAPRDNAPVTVTFSQTVAKAGERRYRVHTRPLPGELIEDDNDATVVVSVRDNKLRVLVVAGAPSWTYRYLTRLLTRDQTVDVSTWLQSAAVDAVRDGNTIIDHLPTDDRELFAYDAIVLLDPDPDQLPLGWCASVHRMVAEHGGGVVYEAAKMYSPRFLRDAACAPIVDLLPVEVGTESSLVLNEMGLFQQQDNPLVVPAAAVDNPIMRQSADRSINAKIWSALAGVYWHYPVLRPKPVATVLATHSDPRMANNYGRHVLIAAQPVGLGRSAFVGFSGTWRWRAIDPRAFERFWIQLVRYTGEGKLLAGRSRATLRTDHESYQLGDVVNVALRLLDENFQPSRDANADISIEGDGATDRLTLAAEPDRPGWFSGRYLAKQSGRYRAVFSPDDWKEEPVAVAFNVSQPDIERRDPRMNRAALETIAAGSAGGRYVSIDEAMQIPELIEDRHREQTIRSTPKPMWDRWWVFAVLVGLLGAEWTIRKRANLM